MARIFAISDLHVDHPDNLRWLEGLPFHRYENDVILVAGDVTDKLPLLKSSLITLTKRFKTVYFVPGNHELWVKDRNIMNNHMNSVEKFERILDLCETIGVRTDPGKEVLPDGDAVWIVPLFSWYATPEDDKQDSLHITASHLREDVKLCNQLWMDNHNCAWPKDLGMPRAKFFCKLNNARTQTIYDAPVITFSHFLPRKELVKSTIEDDRCIVHERRHLGKPLLLPKRQGSIKGFNFTRYAGCHGLDAQVRTLGSFLHVYGHQHRNRDRVIDGVRYVSHCLGYKREREEGFTYGIREWNGPKQVYPSVHNP
ncbi:uncharacterized protein LOC115923992 [Strongylocentrotus purpuratus]|uniref:Calcineurin-like phosphoesterase domain-containing protein n=1 Tax=Strongylocentrotus purpuratus TaxID=7668 RepID=A0A7M7NT69_STRPU|nr:uncharacterized protein LOC115923992 [Strongylocentrotus purpuratus]